MKRVLVGLLLVCLLAGCASSGGGAGYELPAGIDPQDPLAATVLLREGETFLRDGRVELALSRFQTAAKLQPANPVVHNYLGLAWLAKNEPAKALEAFTRALSLAPTYTDARNNRGLAYRNLGQLTQAETEFLAALQDNTYANRAGVYFNLGALYASQGKWEAAEENLRKAATPTGPVEAHLLLGQVQERLGKFSAAQETYRRGMDRAPERSDLAFRLALLLWQQGNLEEARQLFRKVAELAPDSPEAAEARGYLTR